MPYFYNKEKGVNVLLIHVPKTGGTSISYYFSKKYNIPLDTAAIYTIPSTLKPSEKSLQHYSYNAIMDGLEKGIEPFTNIDLSGMQVLAAVRNPYDRVLSDMFFYKMINSDTSKEHFYEILRDQYIGNRNNRNFDNHNLPQTAFLMGALDNDNITILKTESLDEEMHKIGYTDFNVRECITFHRKAYREFLNADSIRMINDFYFMDFEYFGYDRLS